MAMMISKFHRLIQSRLLWFVFLGVVVIVFVFWGVQLPPPDAGREPPGWLDGKPVPAAEFAHAYTFEELRLRLQHGERLRVDDDLAEAIRQAAWRRLVALREAERMKLRVYDEEVLRAIRSIPDFQHNGVFSRAAYGHFIAELAQWRGLTERGFEQFLREELLLERLREAVRHTVAVPATERDARLAELTARASAAVVAIADADVEDEVEVDAEAARRHFEADPGAYRVPPKVRARMVFFDAARHEDEVGPFDEEDIEDYYHTHAARFRRLAFDPPEEEGQPARPRWQTVPLDEAREEIRGRLRRQAAIARARERATDFMRLTAPYFTAQPIPFEEAAERLDLEVQVTAPFARGEAIPDTSLSPRAAEVVYGLQPAAGEDLSDPLTGDDGVYVFALEERIPARIPAFEEVAEQATEDALRARLAEARLRRAESVRRRVLTDGLPLAEAAEAEGLTARETEPFDGFEGLPEDPHGPAIVQAAEGLNPGEISEPIPARRAQTLLVQVLDREPGDPEAFADLRDRMQHLLVRQRAAQRYEAWVDDLLRRAEFRERGAASAADDRG